MKKEEVNFIAEEYSILYREISMLDAVVELLSKDLYLCGITDYSFQELKADQFVVEAVDFINYYLKNHSELLRALLYRIDIKEEEIVQVFENSKSDQELSKGILKLILIRLIEKVLNRKKY